MRMNIVLFIVAEQADKCRLNAADNHTSSSHRCASDQHLLRLDLRWCVFVSWNTFAHSSWLPWTVATNICCLLYA